MRLTHFISGCVSGVVLLLGMSLRLAFTPSLIGATFCCAVSTVGGAERSDPKRIYSLPHGDAATMLKQFAAISGSPVLFMMDHVRGEQTNAVNGEFSSAAALKLMLAGTSLEIMRESAVDGFVIGRRASSVQREEGGRDPKRQPKNMTPQTLPVKIRAWLAHAALAMATVASAQDANQPSKNDTASSTKEEIVVLSPFSVSSAGADRYRANDALSAVRVRAKLIDTGSSISVLTRDFIDDVAPGRLFDVTRYVAGVQEGRFYNFLERTIIRGFQNDGRTVDNFLNASGQNYDEALVERIEVSKGPNAILSPAGGPGGTINVVTKSPEFTARRVLSAQAGLYDSQRASLDFTGPVEGAPQLAYRLIGTLQDSRREWTSDARLRRKILSPQLTYRLSDKTEISLKVMYNDTYAASSPLYILDSAVIGAGSGAEPRLDPALKLRSRNGIPAWSALHFMDTTANIQLTSTLNDHISVRVAAHTRRSNEDSIQSGPVLKSLSNRYNPFTGVLTLDSTWSIDPVSGNYVPTFSKFFDPTAVTWDTNKATGVTDHYTAGQVDLLANYKLGSITSQTVIGWATANQTQRASYTRAPISTIDLTLGQELALPAFTQLYQDNRSTNRNSQVYVNERLGFWNDRIFLNAGLLHYTVYTTARNALTTAPASILDSSKNMGMGSIVVKPRENLSVYASYSTNGAPSIANNVALWAQGKQFEYGVKSEFLGGRLSVSAAHFQIAQTNVSTPNPARISDVNAPLTVLSDLKDHGIEFEAIGSLTKQISIVAGYTHLKLRDAIGRPLRAVADDAGSLLVNYHFTNGPLKGFAASLGAVHSGKKAGDLPSPNFTPLGVPTKVSFFVPAYTLYNLNLTYRWHRTKFALFVDNLFDVDGITQGGGVGGLGLSPAWRRNVKFSTSFEF